MLTAKVSGKRSFQQIVHTSALSGLFGSISVFQTLLLELFQRRKSDRSESKDQAVWPKHIEARQRKPLSVLLQNTWKVHSMSWGVNVTRAWGTEANCVFWNQSSCCSSLSRFYQQTSAAVEESELEKHQGLRWLPAVFVETQHASQLNLITAGHFVRVCLCVCVCSLWVQNIQPWVFP